MRIGSQVDSGRKNRSVSLGLSHSRCHHGLTKHCLRYRGLRMSLMMDGWDWVMVLLLFHLCHDWRNKHGSP